MNERKFPRLVRDQAPEPESQSFVPGRAYLRSLQVARGLLRDQKTDEAFESYDRALDETRPDVEGQARVYYERALALMELGRPQDALNDLNEAYSRIIAGEANLPNGVLTIKILKKRAYLSQALASQDTGAEPKGEQSSSA